MAFAFNMSLSDDELDEAREHYDHDSTSELRNMIREDMKENWRDDVLGGR
jgi:hypothetical protein